MNGAVKDEVGMKAGIMELWQSPIPLEITELIDGEGFRLLIV